MDAPPSSAAASNTTVERWRKLDMPSPSFWSVGRRSADGGVFRTNRHAGQEARGPSAACRTARFARWSRTIGQRLTGVGGDMAGEIEARLKALDLVLPEVETAPGRQLCSFLHLAASCSFRASCRSVTARWPSPASSAPTRSGQGEEAARLCALNILAQAKAALRDLDRIVQLLRLNGFVNAAPGFHRPSQSASTAPRISWSRFSAIRGAIPALPSAAPACRSAPPSRSMRSSPSTRPSAERLTWPNSTG